MQSTRTTTETNQQRLRQGEHFILSEVSILVLIVEVEEPFDVLHEIIEHDAIHARDNILQMKSVHTPRATLGLTDLERESASERDIPEEKETVDELVVCKFTVYSLLL